MIAADAAHRTRIGDAETLTQGFRRLDSGSAKGFVVVQVVVQ